VVAKFAARYSFVKTPSIGDFEKDKVQTFGWGKFKDVQITEVGVYNDGTIVSSRSDTRILDDFLDDVFSWLNSEFGLETAAGIKPEKHYESVLVVKATTDLTEAIAPPVTFLESVNKKIRSHYPTKVDFGVAGFSLDCDPLDWKMKRKPMRFGIDRRAGGGAHGRPWFWWAQFEAQTPGCAMRATRRA